MDDLSFAMLLQISVVSTGGKEDNNEKMMVIWIQTQDHRYACLFK